MGALRLVNGEVVEDKPKLRAKFYEHAVRKSIDKWDTAIYVLLKAPGNRDDFSRPATEQDKLDYPEAWSAFQAGVEQSDEGTPLGQLPACKKAFELELKHLNVDTVEKLAELDEPPADYLEKMWKQARMFVELEKMDGS